MNIFMFYMGGALPLIWGIAHLFPTRNVVKDFGDISEDNRNIIRMEWINEGATLIFLGILIILVTAFGKYSELATLIYWVVIAMLNVLSLISIFTGFKVNFLPFKLCPLIFTGSSILILLGILI